MAIVYKIICLIMIILLGNSTLSLARDSGEENVIPVSQWRCSLCSQEFFTFYPDDLAANSSSQHKDPNFQQRTWVKLKTKDSLHKCDRSNDGAHIFSLVRNTNISPTFLARHLDQYIVLKNGRSLKVALNAVKCNTCGMEGYCFDGDDLDGYDSVRFTDRLHIYSLYNQSLISPCRGKLPSGYNCQAHLFLVKGKNNPRSSLEIADYFRKILYSD